MSIYKLIGSMSVSVLILGACGDNEQSSPPVRSLDFSTKTIATGSLPELAPSLTMEETRALRQQFSWDRFDRVPERDAEGRPTLYYALLYVDRLWQRDYLRGVGFHTSFVPLFEGERTQWEGQTGVLTLEGDREGVFIYSIVPGAFLNRLKTAADEGEPAFKAVVVREPPEPGAVGANGTLDYAYLASEGFVYGGLPRAGAVSTTSQGVAVRQSALFSTPSRALRAFVSPAEDIIDEVRAFFGELDRAAAGTAEITVTVVPINTDPAFPVGSPIVRAWGSGRDADKPWVPTLGETLVFRDVTVQSHKGASLFRGNTGPTGEAVLRVAQGPQNICVELANPAAEVTNFLSALVVCNFNSRDSNPSDLNLDITGDTRIVMNVQDYRANFFAQAQDSYDYMTWVVGRSPRQVRIMTGFFADAVGEFNEGRAFVACLGDSLNLPTFVLSRTPVLNNLLPLDVDIVMPNDQGISALSRGVLTHEYGHFALCDLMHQTNAWKFAESWTNVTTNVFGGPGDDNDIVYINEAFADFFALQVVGATNYPTLNGANARSNMSYCPLTPQADARDCGEDNVGGPTQGIGNIGTQNYNIARAVSLLHDAFDGAAAMNPGLYPTTPGAAFSAPDAPGFIGAPALGDTNANDESVALPGAAYIDFVRNLFDFVSTLDERNFHNALARTALQYGHTPQQVCEMFNLHAGVAGVPGLPGVADYRDCRDMIDPSILDFAGIPPSAPSNIRVLRNPAQPGNITFLWNDLSPIADRYELELSGGPGALTDSIGYSRSARYMVEGLAPDTEYRFTTTTVNGTERASSSAPFVTFAAPPTSVTAAPGPGSATITWTVVDPATAYEVWQIEPEARRIGTATTPSFVVRGLSGQVDYQFAVAALNQVGEAGVRVVSDVVRPEAPTVVYVAPDGSDISPDAGTEVTPFATVAAAVQAALARDMDEVWLLEGTYAETAAVLISRDLRIVGGMTRGPSGWSPGPNRSRIVTEAQGAEQAGPSTRLFNESNRTYVSSVTIDDGVTLTTSAIDWRLEIRRLVRGCISLLQVDGTLDLRDSEVVVVPYVTVYPFCTSAVSSLGGTVRLDNARIVGLAETGDNPAVADVAGLVARDASLDLQDSTIVGFAGRDAGSTGINVDLAGLTAVRLNSLRASRVTITAMTPEVASVRSDRVRGLDASFFGSAVIDNSVIRTPSGARNNVALDLASALVAGSPGVTLAHVTAVAGAQWDLDSLQSPGLPRAALRLEGRLRQFVLVNSVLSYAAGAQNAAGHAWTGLSLRDVAGTFDQVIAQGNVFSVPLLDRILPAFPAADDSFITCSDTEFDQVDDAAGVNLAAIYACNNASAPTASWSIGNNRILGQLPRVSSTDLPGDPHSVGFDTDGRPEAAFAHLTSSVTRVRSAGVNLDSLPVRIESSADRGGAVRSDANVQGAGAWVVQ